MIIPAKNPSFSKLIFTAMARENFFLREHIIKFILEKKHTPNSAFAMFSYFLLDTVERKSLIAANNELIKRSDEIWVFGIISDGVLQEIKLAESLNMPIKYFKVDLDNKCCTFKKISGSRAKYKKYCKKTKVVVN
jgi:hypothetical protein